MEAQQPQMDRIEASSSIGRVPVSKTGGCEFDSCLACLLKEDAARHLDERAEEAAF